MHIAANKGGLLAIIFTASLALNSATFAQTPQNAHNTSLEGLLACKQLSVSLERLDCFDRESAALSARGPIAIVTPEDVRENQRRLFGLSATFINPFGGGAEDLASIQANTTEFRNLGRNQWLITLDDGSVWRKIDASEANFSLHRQHTVVVRRAAMGSYMMKIGDNPPFRVRRE